MLIDLSVCEKKTTAAFFYSEEAGLRREVLGSFLQVDGWSLVVHKTFYLQHDLDQRAS